MIGMQIYCLRHFQGMMRFLIEFIIEYDVVMLGQIPLSKLFLTLQISQYNISQSIGGKT